MASKVSRDKESIPSIELARLAADLAAEKKGQENTILDLRQFSVGCKYFVITTAESDRHVRALADWIEEGIRARTGEKPWHREGLTVGRWVLLDYVDAVVHIFDRDARDTYMLERLWGDAPRENVGEEAE